ncbi:MAG: hypothetical protein E6Q76_12135 [Rhizobium sp.]|nr:MAG: hypothetical protein E6Q76_12135 [Rhizobium sp.]
MTVAIARAVLERFLTSSESEVLALTGAWGVGKTFAWNAALKDAALRSQIKRPQYCYVSLFGLKTINDLRLALFSKLMDTSIIGKDVTLKVVNEEWLALGKAQVRGWLARLRPIANAAPKGGATISVAIDTFAPYFVKDALICLDDLERTEINVADVLGLISELKEERNCKIALLFNFDKLDGKTKYREYKEKVVDYEVVYAPTVAESTSLVFPADLEHRELVERTVAELEIVNVRVLRRMVHVLNRIAETTQGMHDDVRQQALVSGIFLSWVVSGLLRAPLAAAGGIR